MAFGLPNINGSCWVNGALQTFFACPAVRAYYSKQTEHEDDLNKALYTVFSTQGREGLPAIFDAVRNHYMPAGKSIGDSHELLLFLCDKLPWLEKQVQFKIADAITCSSCSKLSMQHDHASELAIYPSKPDMTFLDAMLEVFQPQTIEGWKCESCNARGCTKQTMFESFPKVLLVHNIANPVRYSSVLNMNGHKFVLHAVLCYNGIHWWTYARIDGNWFRLDDSRVTDIKHLPITNAMRVLLYFLDEN